MSLLTLEHCDRNKLAQDLAESRMLVACLCAAWCDVCRQFRPAFEQMAARHPEQSFAWIDIEDQADLVGDIDVENFPTLLIQRGDTVAFFGTILPDARVAERLLQAQTGKSLEELQAEAQGSPERRAWQRDVNLRPRLAEG